MPNGWCNKIIMALSKQKTENKISNLAIKFGKKESLDNVELTAEQVKILEHIPVPPEYKKKKLICRIWNEEGTRTIRKPIKITYGKPYFTCKVGTKDRFFRVNYSTKGIIKIIDGKMYYDIAFDNTLGGIALGNVEFPEDMDSEEAYTVFKNNAVNMYVKKGGIPLMYLLVAMIAVTVMAFAIIATVPAGLQAQENVKFLDEQVTQLKKDNAILQQQLTQAQQQVIR